MAWSSAPRAPRLALLHFALRGATPNSSLPLLACGRALRPAHPPPTVWAFRGRVCVCVCFPSSSSSSSACWLWFCFACRRACHFCVSPAGPFDAVSDCLAGANKYRLTGTPRSRTRTRSPKLGALHTVPMHNDNFACRCAGGWAYAVVVAVRMHSCTTHPLTHRCAIDGHSEGQRHRNCEPDHLDAGALACAAAGALTGAAALAGAAWPAAAGTFPALVWCRAALRSLAAMESMSLRWAAL